MSGNLYIISTPIGNLEDISYRAIKVLSSVDVIAVEDKRVTSKLLNHYDIKKQLITYNDFNENYKYNNLIELLNNNKNIAIVSDAGTPCISDPGYRVVNAAIKNDIKVISVPGPSSVVSAMSISGLPSDKFFFEGFLPKKKGLNKRLNFLKDLEATVIIFESPKRLIKTLNNIFEFMGDRVVSVCKEITKIHENTCFGTVSSILENFKKNKSIKGEFIILISKKGYEL